jgi:hypothetical protein
MPKKRNEGQMLWPPREQPFDAALAEAKRLGKSVGRPGDYERKLKSERTRLNAAYDRDMKKNEKNVGRKNVGLNINVNAKTGKPMTNSLEFKKGRDEKTGKTMEFKKGRDEEKVQELAKRPKLKGLITNPKKPKLKGLTTTFEAARKQHVATNPKKPKLKGLTTNSSGVSVSRGGGGGKQKRVARGKPAGGQWTK